VISLSNLSAIDTSIWAKKEAVRIKQASDIKILQQYNAINKVFKNNLDKVDKGEPKNIAEYDYKNKLISDKPYTEIIQDILQFNKQLINELSQTLNTEHLELIGMIDETKTES